MFTNEEWVSYYQWLDYCENNVDHIHVLMVCPKMVLPHSLMIFYKNTCERSAFEINENPISYGDL